MNKRYKDKIILNGLGLYPGMVSQYNCHVILKDGKHVILAIIAYFYHYIY